MTIRRKIYLYFYCIIMSRLWKISYNLYNYCEDRRPGGGFHIKNYYR